MLVKQWVYREHRIDLELLNGNYRSSIYKPGDSDKLSYTPIVEMKHGQRKAEAAVEKFVDERLEGRSPAP
jgi:hypothetical protein